MRYKPVTDLDHALEHLAEARHSLNNHIDGIEQEGLKKAIREETEERLDCLIAYLAGLQLAQRIVKGGLDI